MPSEIGKAEDSWIERGPYTDLSTGNLVLQEIQPPDDKWQREGWPLLADDLNRLEGREPEVRNDITSDEAGQIADRVKTIIEKRDPAFRHTPEYFRAIKNQRERRAAYQAIEVAGIPHQEEAEIEANPFKFLGLPDNATLEQVRSAYVNLSNLYHPDKQNPLNRKQIDLLFGRQPFNLDDGCSLESVLEVLLTIQAPLKKNASDLEEMSQKERDAYTSAHNEYRGREAQHEQVLQEMRLRAHEKMLLVTKAYKAAQNKFSDEITSSLGGFQSERVIVQSDAFNSLMGSEFDGFQYDRIRLEGEGEIRRDVGRLDYNRQIYLAYDFGEAYMVGPDYMQKLYLKSFFAWMDLRLGRELSPLLLEEVVKKYELEVDQAEQLRLMMMNGESSGFILDTLEISSGKRRELAMFIRSAYNPPTFSQQIDFEEDVDYVLGVELTKEGGMILRYRSQESEYNFWSISNVTQTAHFAPADVAMMKVMAYGPMLVEMNSIDKSA